MAKRRPSGDGMVRKREDGRWEGRIVVGHKSNGDSIFRYISAPTQKELSANLDVTSTPLVTEQEIIFGSADRGVFALDKPTLFIKWRAETLPSLVYTAPYSSTPQAGVEALYLHKELSISELPTGIYTPSTSQQGLSKTSCTSEHQFSQR